MKSYQISNTNSLMDELLKSNPLVIKKLVAGDLVSGNVVEVSKDQILVDIGSKSEGIIPKEEFTEDMVLEKTLKTIIVPWMVWLMLNYLKQRKKLVKVCYLKHPQNQAFQHHLLKMYLLRYPTT